MSCDQDRSNGLDLHTRTHTRLYSSFIYTCVKVLNQDRSNGQKERECNVPVQIVQAEIRFKYLCWTNPKEWEQVMSRLSGDSRI